MRGVLCKAERGFPRQGHDTNGVGQMHFSRAPKRPDTGAQNDVNSPPNWTYHRPALLAVFGLCGGDENSGVCFEKKKIHLVAIGSFVCVFSQPVCSLGRGETLAALKCSATRHTSCLNVPPNIFFWCCLQSHPLPCRKKAAMPRHRPDRRLLSGGKPTTIANDRFSTFGSHP
jgi:hypothetical protein